MMRKLNDEEKEADEEGVDMVIAVLMIVKVMWWMAEAAPQQRDDGTDAYGETDDGNCNDGDDDDEDDVDGC